MTQLRFARVQSPLGPLWVAETDAGVAAVAGDDSLEAFLAPLRRRFPDLEAVPADIDRGWLLRGISPPLDLRGLSPFDARVYDVVRSVPAGSTVTYGEVAVLAGSPGAARAVGNAMARCPLFPAVPCHRVVRASDGWSGWGGNDRKKEALLAREREGLVD
jgi:AraC family transcriptional regulator of adaptative response/methylated-DNA-[protein]-cysteine methyltransferase